MTMRIAFMMLATVTLTTACARPPMLVTPPAEQLTCGDARMPRADFTRSLVRTEPDSFAGVVVVVRDTAHRPVLVADVQVWGTGGGAGGPGSPSGTHSFSRRDSGLTSVRIEPGRGVPRWVYAATLRAGYLDTVLVTVGVPCTLIWQGARVKNTAAADPRISVSAEYLATRRGP